MCKYCLTAIKEYSKHDITFCGLDNSNEINKYKCDDFDVVHTHTTHKNLFNLKTAKLIYSVHCFDLSCATGGFYCSVLNKFLKEPLTCLNCLGYVGAKTGQENIKSRLKLAQKADLIVVDSEFIKEIYHVYNPMIIPLPLETDMLIPCNDKEDYIFYTGRLSFEKNPFGFLDIVKKTRLKGKMAVYQSMDTTTKKYYKDFMDNNSENLEIFINPSKEKMMDLVKHAKFTVLPYLYSEPFGIAAANSVLCGTPLVTFPYGNARNMTHLLPKTLNEMIKLIQMDDNQYKIEMEKTLKKSEELRIAHNPINIAKIWEKVYENEN